jgi:uridine kinase
MGVNIIGITGGSASGKTSLAHSLLEHPDAPYAAILSLDNYYRCGAHLTMAEREEQNVDDPNAIDSELFIEHLGALKKGCPIDVPLYDFSLHIRQQQTQVLFPHQYIIIEGIFILCFPEMRELLSYSIFVESPADLRFTRRVERDVKERGRTAAGVREQWDATVEPMYCKFCEPTRSFAKEVFSGVGWNQEKIASLWKNIVVASSS